MQTNEKHSYRSPELEIFEMIVENCIAASIEDPIENPEQDW